MQDIGAVGHFWRCHSTGALLQASEVSCATSQLEPTSHLNDAQPQPSGRSAAARQPAGVARRRASRGPQGRPRWRSPRHL